MGVIETGKTIIEKILSRHAGKDLAAGDYAWIEVDVRSARDFGGASVVKNLKRYFEPPYVDDPDKTFFTFDTNVPARDIGYAENQQICRNFARETGVRVFDVRAGIGSHVAMERSLALPGRIVVGTDSHFNILGAVGCFGQGMGDKDIAYIFARGRNWFEVPETIEIVLTGSYSFPVSAKDVTLAIIGQLGSAGALGRAIEFTGDGVDGLSLSARITIASMATEMGAIASFFPLDDEILGWLEKRAGFGKIEPVAPDPDAAYSDRIEFDLSRVVPMAACPFSPSNVKTIEEIAGTPIDTAFIGSCTNGRFEDMVHAASILKGRKVKEGISLKVVPATTEVYERMLREGILEILVEAGAVVSNPGCGGCAAGQIGMVGASEVQLSTTNRNFKGKQGRGETYLVSPAVAAASVLFGRITSPLEVDTQLLEYIPDERYFTPPELSTISWRVEKRSASGRPEDERRGEHDGRDEDRGKRETSDVADNPEKKESSVSAGSAGRQRTSYGTRGEAANGGANERLNMTSASDLGKSGRIKGRARLIVDGEGRLIDDIDTDMIFHNKYLSITDIEKMGEHTLEALAGYEGFASTVERGDIIIAGSNFGCGSSRQQAVDCFISLGVSLILTESTGAIYKRNIINSGFPFLEVPALHGLGIEEGERLEVDFENGIIKRENGAVIEASKPSSVQIDIYRAGGLFNVTGD